MNMTPRERYLRAVEGKSTDRTPMDFGGAVSGMVAGSDNAIAEGPPYGIKALYEYVGLNDYEEPKVAAGSSIVLNIDERLNVRLGADARHCSAGAYPVEKLADGTLRDMWGFILQPAGFYNSIPDPLVPLRNATTVKEILEYPYWPDPKDPIFLEGSASVRALRETTDYAIAYRPGYAGMIFHTYAHLRGFDNFLMDMRLNKKFYDALTEKITEVAISIVNETLAIVGPYVDIVIFSDDVGMQTQPFMAIEQFRKHIKPFFKRWISAVKQIAPHTKILYHTCGAVFDMIPDFIDCGVDILNPIQPLAFKMEPWRLKKNYGSRICFHGGVDIQKLLNFGTPEKIKNEVKKILAIFEGNKYILAPSHNIEPDTPPENIVAMYDAAVEYAEGR